MTDRADRLQEIRDRVEAATRGPWKAQMTVFPVAADIFVDDRPDCLATTAFHGWTRQEQEANADFIARARQDVPWLLDEVERLQGRIRQAVIVVAALQGEIAEAHRLLNSAGVPDDGKPLVKHIENVIQHYANQIGRWAGK